MNAHAARTGRWPYLGFALAAAIALGLAAGLLGGVLSRTFLLDLLALWPVAALVVVGGALAWWFRRRRPRLIAIPGLIIFTWLVIGLALHLSEVDWLPSAAGDVVRPAPIGAPRARMVVDLAGSLSVAPMVEPGGYSVLPMRAGGEVGAPEALEQTAEGLASILVVDRDDSDWFRFRGWDVRLDAAPAWDLEISARDVDADLTGLRIDAAEVTAPTGAVALGAPLADGSALGIDGNMTVAVPESAPVTVVGAADVPEGWESTEGGARAPAEGTGWTIEVAEGGQVTIR